jgi:hypothetical protein
MRTVLDDPVDKPHDFVLIELHSHYVIDKKSMQSGSLKTLITGTSQRSGEKIIPENTVMAGIYPKKPAPGVSRTLVYSPIIVFPKRAGLVPALAEVMLPFL